MFFPIFMGNGRCAREDVRVPLSLRGGEKKMGRTLSSSASVPITKAMMLLGREKIIRRGKIRRWAPKQVKTKAE